MKRKFQEKPARVQAAEIETAPEDLAGGMYNIWYHKTAGDYSTWRDRRELKLQGTLYRCDPVKDAGKTKAKPDAYICLYFARGKCVQGSACSFFHRIPTEEDDYRMDMSHDVFGRDRHRTDREDMGGIGSFERNNKTLYIGGLRRSADQEKVIRQHFGAFGEIQYLRVIHSKSIAFVQYKLRTAAEFAKEAMADQSMDGEEVINVRWANEDPNPNAQVRKKADLENEAVKALKERYPDYYNYYADMYAFNQYPNTDNQFNQSYDTQTEHWTEDQWKRYNVTRGNGAVSMPTYSHNTQNEQAPTGTPQLPATTQLSTGNNQSLYPTTETAQQETKEGDNESSKELDVKTPDTKSVEKTSTQEPTPTTQDSTASTQDSTPEPLNYDASTTPATNSADYSAATGYRGTQQYAADYYSAYYNTGYDYGQYYEHPQHNQTEYYQRYYPNFSTPSAAPQVDAKEEEKRKIAAFIQQNLAKNSK